MTDGARVMRRHLRAWPPTPRTGAVVIATAALGLLAPACSGSQSSAGSGGSPAAGGSAGSPSAVAYSACMRSHRVPNFPDPPGSGQVPKPNRSNSGSAPPAPGRPKILPAPVPEQQRDARRLAQAMRGNRQLPAGHGAPGDEQHACVFSLHARPRVPNWPDPTVDSEGRPGFDLVPIHGTDWNGPQIQNKIYECEHVMPRRRRGSSDLPWAPRLSSGAPIGLYEHAEGHQAEGEPPRTGAGLTAPRKDCRRRWKVTPAWRGAMSLTRSPN
jgi:hypothetical protein